MTGWAANVKNAGALMRIALSDTRKLKKNILVVSHGDTLATLGAPKGMGKAKDAAMAKILLEVDIDPVTKEACPKFCGVLQLPGREPEPVSIEKLPPLPPGAFESLTQQPLQEFGEVSNQQQPPINLEKTPETPEPTPKPDPVQTLEALLVKDSELPASVLNQAEWELLGIAGAAGTLTVRDAQKSNLARREGWDSSKIKALFARFSELGLGSIQHGARGSVEFRVNGGQGNG